MLKTNNNLIKIFETERWLYVDGELDESRKAFWDNQIKDNSELENLLLEVQAFTGEFANEFDANIDGNKFNAIMENVFNTDTQNIFRLLLNKLSIMKKERNNGGKLKLAFASGIIFAVISFMFFLQKPTPNHSINSKFLVWDDTSFSKTLSGVEFEYTGLADEKVAQYIQYQLANDKWLRDVVSIKNEIDKLSAGTNNKSL